jgi:hypothetical protein
MSVQIKEKILSVKEIMEFNLDKDDKDNDLYILVKKESPPLFLKINGLLEKFCLNKMDIALYYFEDAYIQSLRFNLDIVKKPAEWKYILPGNL